MNKFLKNLFLILLIFSSTVFSQTVKVKIIETSDVHGAIFPYDFLQDKPARTSLAQVMTYLKEQRADTNQIVFLLDNGDKLQGNPAVYYINFEKKEGKHLLADIMNFMQYDAATVGNHDIEPGPEVYNRFRNDISFDWLAANAIDESTNKPYFKPYTTIERGGIKIAVFGMITPYVPNWLPEKLYKGIRFDDMIETAKEWVKKIRAWEQPDILIGLFHAGVDASYGGQNVETYKNENAAELVAKNVPGFDIVFVGHDHQGHNYKIRNVDDGEVLILGPQANARTLAVANLTLKFDKHCSFFEIKEKSGEIIDVRNYKPDEEFLSRYSNLFDEIKKYSSQKIGENKTLIKSADGIFGPSVATDLINSIQLELTGADISFTPPFSFNDVVEAGDLHVRDIFSLLRYENYLYTMELTGKEIKDYLEYSYGNWLNQMKDENDHLLRFKKNEKGELILSNRTNSPELYERFYNYDCAAGIDYEVDVTKPVGERIKIKKFSDGRKFNLNEKYKVAINSYRGSGGGGHLTRGAGIPKEDLNKRILKSTDTDFRYYVIEYVKKKKVIEPKLLNNWKIVPENFWLKGKAKDYQILFGKN
jgi:2',3'-cyclic-nucleotide 2'-phosphodiesterase/3'-nucleotidase